MSSFSIIDDNASKKYKVGFVPIFEQSQSAWNNSTKTNAFSIVCSSNQSLLFTGYFSCVRSLNLQNPVDITIRFNLHGDTTNYIYQNLQFYFPLEKSRAIIPINFIKSFLINGSYDVNIYINGTTFITDSNDTLYLNATLYDIDTTGFFF